MSTLKKHQEVLVELLKEFDRICQKHDIKYQLFCGSALGAVRHKGLIPWDDDLDVAMIRNEYEKLLRIAPTEISDKYYLQAEFSEHWPMCFSKFRKNNTTCLEKYHPKDKEIHQGIYIDIFPIDNAFNNSFLKKIQYFGAKVVYAKALYKRGYETDSNTKRVFMLLCRILPLKLFRKIAMLKNQTNSQIVHSFLGCSSKYSKGFFERKWIENTVLMDFEGAKFPVSAYYDDVLKLMYNDYMRIPTEEERKVKVHAIMIDTERNYTEYENYRDGMKFDVYTRNIH